MGRGRSEQRMKRWRPPQWHVGRRTDLAFTCRISPTPTTAPCQGIGGKAGGATNLELADGMLLLAKSREEVSRMYHDLITCCEEKGPPSEMTSSVLPEHSMGGRSDSAAGLSYIVHSLTWGCSAHHMHVEVVRSAQSSITRMALIVHRDFSRPRENLPDWHKRRSQHAERRASGSLGERAPPRRPWCVRRPESEDFSADPPTIIGTVIRWRSAEDETAMKVMAGRSRQAFVRATCPSVWPIATKLHPRRPDKRAKETSACYFHGDPPSQASQDKPTLHVRPNLRGPLFHEVKHISPLGGRPKR